jgi:hypothetical protein
LLEKSLAVGCTLRARALLQKSSGCQLEGVFQIGTFRAAKPLGAALP